MCAGSGRHWNTGHIAGTTASSAGTGAVIGSGIAPGIGTAIGGAIGLGVGLFTGLLSGSEADEEPLVVAPPPEDLTDQIIRRGRLAARSRLLAEGSGSFVAGPMGTKT